VRCRDGEWAYDAERYAKVTELRRREQAVMASFGTDGRCLMRALQEELDDPEPQDCGRCSVCAGPRYDAPPAAELVRAALEHLRSRPLTLESKKMSPGADGKMRKIAAELQLAEGRALARIGDGGWDPLVQSGRREGRFDDELVRAAAALVRDWQPPATWVAAVPSLRTGELVPDFARRLAAELGLAFAPVLERVDVPPSMRTRPSQREMANSAQQVANVRGAFAVSGEPPPGPCLLVDDLRLSGWTQAMVGGQLRMRGSGPVFPLVLATAF
jgi:ATP-dependent DNA helicase RecQ